ncbi:MAG: hypothetical protein E6K72_07210 [Candidatus Eisenbacteria bacterium]|uniref:ParB/Sulfiredoxin domain-containing protein n=1 Tax=Eiseniibacteriota bacterium TaxID=2212470 RepID=A0A538SU90_UNCEI|nr:MAG: hypothetical protein E6K72_07210 [Candidatus Eisenbacteria bacterium]
MSERNADEHALPELRFVALNALVPHEQHDPMRLVTLVSRIREQGRLRNPPVVAPLPGGGERRYVVLDGANRAHAVGASGFPHVVVQVVPYTDPPVRLTTWCHALGDTSRDHFENALHSVPGLECRRAPLLHASALLARRETLAYVAFADGTADTLHGGGGLRERNAMLNALVDTYRGSKRFFRVTSESLPAARERHPEIEALVVFPHFQPAEVIEIAAGGERLPAGITRHVIRWRALRVDVPLDRLADTATGLVEKNRWLEEWLLTKLRERHVRFYEEPTVLFDE